MQKILEFENVCLNYFTDDGEVQAVKDLSLSVFDGEFVSIVGPSGCGKTTILSLISGLIFPTSGKIFLQNQEIFKKSAKNRQKNSKKVQKSAILDKKTVPNKSTQIGYMFQKDQLLPWRNVEKNIYLGLEVSKTKTPENILFAEKLLKKYGLFEFRNKLPPELSGGMRQRVALIRTLVLRPKLILLDEAFSALDYQTRLAVCDDIYSILKQEKITTILVTHDISEAISLSDRIIVLTQRPAQVLNIHKISIPGTPFERRECPKAKNYFLKIWRELQYEN